MVMAVFMSVNASAQQYNGTRTDNRNGQVVTTVRGHEQPNIQGSHNAQGHMNGMQGSNRGHNAYGYEYNHREWLYGVPAASPQEVDVVINAIRKMSFDSQKLEMARVCLMLRPMFAEDIARVAKCFNFDSDKLKFLKDAYPNCVDKMNKRFLEESMTFMSGCRDIRDFMERYDREHR